MRINPRLWIIIIIVSLVIITVKYFNFNQKEKYFFERNMVDENRLKPTDNGILDSISNRDFINLTYNILTVYDKKKTENNRYMVALYDISKNKIVISTETNLPLNSIIFVKDSSVFYIDRFTLYSKNLFNNRISEITKQDFKIFNAFPLAKNNEYIVLGECKTNNLNKVGFFKYNSKTNSISVIKGIDTETKETNKNFLIYAGTFSSNLSYITYALNKTSNVFIFDLKGDMVKHIKTKENVPNPQIVEFNSVFGYKRGFTFSTNTGIFLDKDNVCVLSNRCKSLGYLAIDKYSLTTGEYISTFKIEKTSIDNKDINNVFQVNDKIIFNSANDFYSYSLH